jgi:hypothetical protein
VEGFVGQASAQFGGWEAGLRASGVPRGMRLWITEYNLQNIRPVAAYETWAHGLLVASMALHMLRISSVDLALAHTLESNSTQWGAVFTQDNELRHLCCGWGEDTVPYASTAAGYLLGGLATAMRGDFTSATALSFAPCPAQQAWGVYCGGCADQNRSYAAVQGFAFAAPRGGSMSGGALYDTVAAADARAVVVLSLLAKNATLDLSGVATPPNGSLGHRSALYSNPALV